MGTLTPPALTPADFPILTFAKLQLGDVGRILFPEQHDRTINRTWLGCVGKFMPGLSEVFPAFCWDHNVIDAEQGAQNLVIQLKRLESNFDEKLQMRIDFLTRVFEDHLSQFSTRRLESSVR